VTRIGPDSGDVSGVEVALISTPGAAIAGAFETLQGIEGAMVTAHV
jgi:hypothetical protein